MAIFVSSDDVPVDRLQPVARADVAQQHRSVVDRCGHVEPGALHARIVGRVRRAGIGEHIVAPRRAQA